jgi:hypothetical protein
MMKQEVSKLGNVLPKLKLEDILQIKPGDIDAIRKANSGIQKQLAQIRRENKDHVQEIRDRKRLQFLVGLVVLRAVDEGWFAKDDLQTLLHEFIGTETDLKFLNSTPYGKES